MGADGFAGLFSEEGGGERLSAGAVLLRGYALSREAELLAGIDAVRQAAPLRHMSTPGGLAMSVATTSCGALGWVSDRRGYRYSAVDPVSGQPWPTMPAGFLDLAHQAAAAAGFADFVPDACLINCYLPGSKLSLHQDKDERDFAAPIVSVSLGLPAVFLLGGLKRTDRSGRIQLFHGDVLAWGGPDRLRFHGVLPLADGFHPLLGARRVNLTFRKAA